LVGWYLMMPPAAQAPRFDLKAPLSKWDKKASFSSQKECNDALAARRAQEVRDGTTERFWAFGKCVAADDPRRKGD
jgi:hypothetical protein